MAIKILANSLRLVWSNKRLLLIPLVGGILSLLIGCFALISLGAGIGENMGDIEHIETWTDEDFERLGDTLADATDSQWVVNLVQGVITFFFQFATLSAIFRALVGQPYAVGSAIGETWSRSGRVILFALVFFVLAALNAAINFILVGIFPGLLAILFSIALWLSFIVATYFLLPIAVSETTGPIQAIARSWLLGRRVAPTLIGGSILLVLTLIVYGIGLTIGMGLLFLLLTALARVLLVVWFLALIAAILIYGLSAQVFFAAFQAQLYQHAVALVDGHSNPAPPADIDEDAFHKAKR